MGQVVDMVQADKVNFSFAGYNDRAKIGLNGAVKVVLELSGNHHVLLTLTAENLCDIYDALEYAKQKGFPEYSHECFYNSLAKMKFLADNLVQSFDY